MSLDENVTFGIAAIRRREGVKLAAGRAFRRYRPRLRVDDPCLSVVGTRVYSEKLYSHAIISFTSDGGYSP